MKILIPFIGMALAFAQISYATCADTFVSKAAEKLNLAGSVRIISKDNHGIVRAENFDYATEWLASSSDAYSTSNYQFIRYYTDKQNSEIISQVFSLPQGGNFIAVVRNKKTCEISLIDVMAQFGAVYYPIVATGMTESSISYTSAPGLLTEIIKMTERSKK